MHGRPERSLEIHVLTKGPKSSPNAFTEKVCWCKQHMPGVPVTLTENKGLVYGRVLVDDWPSYVEAWLKFRARGLVIMPDRPWNQGFEHPNLVRFGELVVAEDGPGRSSERSDALQLRRGLRGAQGGLQS